MRYALSNVLGDPFWLTTMPMALVGWVVALVGSILNNSLDASNFPVFSWWGLAFEMLAIFLTLHVAFTNQIRMYRQAILALLAIATVYTTNSTNNFVWRNNTSSGTAAAGNILLSIINFIWILYFGTSQDEPVHTYIDSFAARKKMSQPASEIQRRMREKRRADIAATSSRHRSVVNSRLGTAAQPYRMSDVPQNITIGTPMDFSHQTDQANPGGNLSVTGQQSNPRSPAGAAAAAQPVSDPLNSTYLYSVDQLHRHGLAGHEVTQEMTGNVNQRLSFGTVDQMNGEGPYLGDNDDDFESSQPIGKARARFSYDARLSDGELPFKEGEVLDICDMTGNWWYCKRSNGEMGICPRNYLELLDETLL